MTNKIAKLSDLPDTIAGMLIPSYDVWVKICSSHGVKVPVDVLEFVIDNPDPWPEYAPYSYKCIRCGNVWNSHYLWSKRENIELYGKIPATCNDCGLPNWFKPKRFPREPTRGTLKKRWKDTKVYREIRAR